MTIFEKLNILIEKETNLCSIIKEYESFFIVFKQEEHSHLSKQILTKIISLQENFISQPDNLLLVFSTVRYMFETLIHLRLIEKETDYVYKLFYSIYNHQVDKTQKLIDRLKYEIQLIDKYVKLEEINSEKLKSFKNSNETKAILEDVKNGEAAIDEEAEKELTIFFGDYKFNGFPYQKHLMENEMLNKLQIKLTEYQNLKTQKSKSLLKNKTIASLFNFNRQHSKVFKELKDTRSWEEKAKETGLDNEYIQLYELSSSILHSTSYSLMTSVDLENSEKQYAFDLICKYSNEIIKTIFSILDIEKLKNLKIVNLEN